MRLTYLHIHNFKSIRSMEIRDICLLYTSSAYVSRGSRILGSTPGSWVGISKLKNGSCLVGAFAMDPSRIASMMPRVSRIEIRLPVPFQPVLTRYAFAPLFSILLTSSSAYLVGCSSRNACPKQAENVGVGSVMPRSVPASFAVNPDRK